MLPNFSKEEIMSMDFGLAGKTAIITGGAAGIGNMTAEYLLKQGVNVVLADMNPGVNDIAKEMGEDKAIGVAGNVCDAEYRACLLYTSKEKDILGKDYINIIVSLGMHALTKGSNDNEEISRFTERSELSQNLNELFEILTECLVRIIEKKDVYKRQQPGRQDIQ